jgi:hypothetical protein
MPTRLKDTAYGDKRPMRTAQRPTPTVAAAKPQPRPPISPKPPAPSPIPSATKVLPNAAAIAEAEKAKQAEQTAKIAQAAPGGSGGTDRRTAADELSVFGRHPPEAGKPAAPVPGPTGWPVK